jgi:hypothetical protein
MKAENIAILRQAANTRDVERRAVIDNIRELETQSQSGKAKLIDPASVEGNWQLVFSSIPGGAANGFLVGGFFDGYFSLKEVVDFYECSLKTNLGSFRGPPSVVTSTAPLEIEFVYTQFKVGPIPGQEVPPNVRSYRFIYVDDEIAVARTSAGGATLLKRIV